MLQALPHVQNMQERLHFPKGDGSHSGKSRYQIADPRVFRRDFAMSGIEDTTSQQQQPAAPPRRISVVGLGVMGSPIARHLAQAGHTLTIYNRSPDKVAAWREKIPSFR
jgi:lactate dehydrogenase-like 2-hydroxyacid dehydrogenase